MLSGFVVFDRVFLPLCPSAVMQLDNTKLSLDSPQVRHGVELSKNQTGVTAKLVHSNYSTSVFFDGFTAQIHMTGTEKHVLRG